jgi:hypothetical protein
MARYPISGSLRAKAISANNISHGNWNSSSSSSSLPRDPFGPAMAQQIFDFNKYEEDIPECSDDEHSGYVDSTGDHWYQTELPLENVREMEQRFQREIQKFECAYRKMIHHALKWHYLMEDLEDNAQLKKQFQDIQLMRKLGGSDFV